MKNYFNQQYSAG